VIRPSQGRYLHTGQHKHKIKAKIKVRKGSKHYGKKRKAEEHGTTEIPEKETTVIH
jgi:hypothetical protein